MGSSPEPTPTLLAVLQSDVTISEGAGQATFTITLNTASTETVTVAYFTANATASSASDYTSKTGTLTFPPGTTSQTVSVLITDDGSSESSETLQLLLHSPGSGLALGAKSTATATITDNDPVLPNLSIDSVSGNEGNAGTSTLTFTVTLSAVSASNVTVDYATADNTATTADSDYVSKTGTLTYTAGQTTKTIDVTINGDTKYETSETFRLNLTNPANATISTAQGTGTLTNDDAAPSIAIDSPSANEGNAATSNTTFTVSLTAASYQSITVDYATANNTATTADSDYTSKTGTLTFASGDTSKTVDVVVAGDTKYEANETFYVNLTNPSNATIGTAQGTGTVTNDDSIPALSIDSVSVTERNAGTTTAVFTVTAGTLSYQTMTVDYATADGTATTIDSDYVARTGTVTFAAGDSSKTISITVNSDTYLERDQTFTVGLSNPSNATISTATGTGTILNDEAAPSEIIDRTSTNPDLRSTNTTWFADVFANPDPAITGITATSVIADNTSDLIFQPASGANPDYLWVARNNAASDSKGGKVYKLSYDGSKWGPVIGNNWDTGKEVKWTDGNGNVDIEGITFAEWSDTFIYGSTERDNGGGASRLSVVRYDVSTAGATMTATHEWNLTADIFSADGYTPADNNKGLEAIGWVPDRYLTDRQFKDDVRGRAYDPSYYPNHGTGLFFVGTESNGHVYVYALCHHATVATNCRDGVSFKRIGVIDTGLGKVMAVRFDRDTRMLWTYADNDANNRTAIMAVDNETATNSATYGKFVVKQNFVRPAGLSNNNYEGIAMAPESSCVDHLKDFFWGDDSGNDTISIRRGKALCGVFSDLL